MVKIKKMFPILIAILAVWNLIYVVLSFVDALYKEKLGVDVLLYNPNLKLILPFVLLIIFAVSFYFSYACYYDFKNIYSEWEKSEGGKKTELGNGAFFYVTKFFYVQGIALFMTLLGAEQISNIVLAIVGL